ncbi:DUF6538 domain-containing protein [Paraburkholderia sp. 32]|uniref:DUF6538 domain-containing protein n=1 Tax=Paraburkholderia sp. 32 TaxID=2991057 RepID=UPI003D1F2444
MARNSHLVKRGSRYYLRRRVPLDLLAHYSGKREIVRALGTSERSEAAILVRRASSDLDAEFEGLRGKALPSLPSVPPRRLGALDQLLEHETGRDETDLAEYSLDDRIRLAVAHALRAHTAPTAAPLPLVNTGARVETAKPVQRVLENAARTLATVVDSWAIERKPTAGSIATMRRHVARLVDSIGDLPVHAITKAHLIAYKDTALSSGSTIKAVNYSLGQIAVLLKFAEGQDWITSNPATGLRMQERRHAAPVRLPFSELALNAIFSSPVYTHGERPRAGAGEAAYWLPLLGLFTGARIEELAQLVPGDIRQETYREQDSTERTVWVMRITADSPGQTLKTAASRRRIPLHPALLDRGLIAYVESRNRETWLFPVRISPKGSHSANFSQWFHRYLREVCGVTDDRMVFHSFRHLWKDTARECGIPKDIRDQWQGHVEPGAGGLYGGEFAPLRSLVEAMARLVVHCKLPG